ncbi:MAG TPA: hypothetical protein VJ761_17125 [Ktedonobacteraceae bacterium]|nr:hypothetical protein [Ktedonobacteraceae bacterium]
MQQTSKRIVVVDQSRTIQVLLRTYFGNAGHQVLTCSTPGEALRTLSSLREAPTMIFLAIDHAKEAYKVITYVKEHRAYSQTSIVVMVLAEERASIQTSILRTLSAISYLVKPFHIQDALKLVSPSVPGNASLDEHAIAREGNT